ncbi:MAG: hypothetical protein M3406_04955 [Chloroflexota bacterium]|nr:hypothetical protein [Chloroflexota bacterium]
MKRTSIPLIALLALVVAACSSGEASQTASATPPPATEEPTASPEPTETSEPSQEPAASGSAGAIPSVDANGDPDLAGRFPDTVGGAPLQVLSFRGDDPMMAGNMGESFQEFLDATDADIEDVSVAVGGSPAGDEAFRVVAFRVMGVGEDALEEEFLAASEGAGDVSGLEESSVGGKDVWTAPDPTGETGGSAFIYVKDDTVYFLTGTEEQAAEILAALP